MADDSNIATDPFDGAAAWATLSPEQQARIGAAALEVAVAGAIAEYLPDPAGRACAEAERIALGFLREAAIGEGGMIDRAWIDDTGPKPQLRIPSALGSVCRACGCSEEAPCEEGCGWHDAVTCTACVAHEGNRL